VPAKSDNVAREGMDKLDFVGELGPALSYYFKGSPHSDEQVSLAFNIRAAVATDFTYLDSIGYSYGTSLHYDRKITAFYHGELQLNTSVKIDFASSEYLNYYYGVESPFVLSNRPFYQVKNGYRGANINLGLSWKSETIWLGSFIKYYNVSNTEQQYSSLVKTDHNWSVGLGLVGIFYKK